MFSKGKSISVFPLKVLYEFVENSEMPLQAGVTASSRHFKKAVQRNRIKRLLREAYRVQKLPLQQVLLTHHKSLALFFIYTGKELPVLDEVQQKMQVILQRLTSNLINPPAKN
ncbi:MAG: ribonuclease P protein component [Bacteroidota bacterium]|nr:ribonuclease P protein component [Bacteroidota bacterium]